MHALLISPTSQLPTIVNMESVEFAQLSFMGYTPIETGTKRQLQLLEEQLMVEFTESLEMNNELN